MPTARLKTRYLENIRPALMERFGYTTPMRAPRIESDAGQRHRVAARSGTRID